LKNEIKLKRTPTAYAADFQGNFFLGFADGTLSKYSNDGELIENYSLPNASSVTLIDAQNNLKPFLFYFDNQEIKILDRFATVPKIYPLAEFGIQIGLMTCPAPDGDIWVVENNPQRLKKISPNRKATLLEIQPILGDSISRMIAYQNLVFIGHEKGIHAFDQFGGEIYLFELSNVKSFQLVGSELIVYTSTEMFRLEAATGAVTKQTSLPMSIEGAFRLKQLHVFIEDRELSFYEEK